MALFTVLGVSYILLAGTVEKQSYMHTCIVGNKMIKEQKNSSAYSMHAFLCINEYHLDAVK